MQKPRNPTIEKPDGLQNLITLASQQLDITKTIASKLSNSLSRKQLTSIGMSDLASIIEKSQPAKSTIKEKITSSTQAISEKLKPITKSDTEKVSPKNNIDRSATIKKATSAVEKNQKTQEKNSASLISGQPSDNRKLENVISKAMVDANKKIEAEKDDEIKDPDKTPSLLENIKDLLASKKDKEDAQLKPEQAAKPSGSGLLDSLFGGKLPFKLGSLGGLSAIVSTALPILVGSMIGHYISKMDMPAVGKGIMSAIGVSGKALINIITKGTTGIKGLPTIIKSIESVFSWVGKLVGKLPLIGNAFKSVGGVVGKVASIGGNLFKAFSGIGKTLGKAFMPILKKLPIISAAAGIYLGIGRIRKGGGLNILQGIMDIVSGIAGATGLGLVVSIPLDVLNFLIDMWKSKNEANEKEGKPRQSMWQWVVSGFKNLGTALWGKIKNTSIVKGAAQMVDGVKMMLGGNILSGTRTFFSSFGTMFPWIGKMFSGVMSMIDTIGDLFSSKNEDATEEPKQSMWSAIWSGFKTISTTIAKKLFSILPNFIQNWFMSDSGNGEKTFDALKPVKTLGKKLLGWLDGSTKEDSKEPEEQKGPSLFEKFADLSREVMLGVVNKLPPFLKKFVSIKDGKLSVHFGKGLSEVGASIKKKWKSWFGGSSENDESDAVDTSTQTDAKTRTDQKSKETTPKTSPNFGQVHDVKLLNDILKTLLNIAKNTAKPIRLMSDVKHPQMEQSIKPQDVKPTSTASSSPAKPAQKDTSEFDMLTKIHQTNEKVANIMLEIKTLNQLLAKTMSENTTMTGQMVGMLPSLAKQQPTPPPPMPTGEYRDPINAFRTDSLFTPTRRLI